MVQLVERNLNLNRVEPALNEAAARSYFIAGLARFDLGEKNRDNARHHLRKATKALARMAKYLGPRKLVDLQIGYHLTMGLVADASSRKKLRVADFRLAVQHFQRARTLAKRVGDVIQEADALHDMANLFVRRSMFPQAQSSLQGVLATFESLREEGPIALAMTVLANSIQDAPRQTIVRLQFAVVLRKLSIRIRSKLQMNGLNEERKRLKALSDRLVSMGIRPPNLTSAPTLIPKMRAGSDQLVDTASQLLRYFRLEHNLSDASEQCFS